MVKHIIKIILVSLILFIPKNNTLAQTDSTDFQPTKVDTSSFEMKKSPWGAVIRSMVLPGFGQFYNESYWKIPIVWGALGYIGYLLVDSNKNYVHYRDLYSESLNKGSENESYLKLREFYKDQRDLNIVFLGLAYFLNLVDAYVDAHLFDFTVTEDIASYKINFRINLF